MPGAGPEQVTSLYHYCQKNREYLRGNGLAHRYRRRHRLSTCLLIRLAIVRYPPRDMPALWVVVGPMDEAAFGVPDVLAVEANAIAYFKFVDSWGDVDVVCDEKRLS